MGSLAYTDEEEFAYEKGYADGWEGNKKANSSDVYGPYSRFYETGYYSGIEDRKMVRVAEDNLKWEELR